MLQTTRIESGRLDPENDGVSVAAVQRTPAPHVLPASGEVLAGSSGPAVSLVPSSKANVLAFLSTRLRRSIVDTLSAFTLEEWQSERGAVLTALARHFPNQLIVVRSSAADEDSMAESRAGYYHSELNIPSAYPEYVAGAIDRVVASYAKQGRFPSPHDQVLVQSQLCDVECAGVVFTRDLNLDAPYFVVNYDDRTGRTDTVTSGSGGSQVLRLASWLPPEDHERPWDSLCASIQELLDVFDSDLLDIEFAIDRAGRVHILQVRPLVGVSATTAQEDRHLEQAVDRLTADLAQHSARRPELAGRRTILADMSDWNPAEILGGRPNVLDRSLYRFLITRSAWNEARSTLGYSDAAPHELMVIVGDKPYIDTRVSFNTLTPDNLPPSLKEDLLDHYLEKLAEHPELQDKVEFDIVFTCFDLTFEERARELRHYGFSNRKVAVLREGLAAHTNMLLQGSDGIIARDMALLEQLPREALDTESILAAPLSPQERLRTAYELLADCRNFGTVPFSRLARLAFIGMALLKSLLRRGTITQEFYDSFLGGLDTVASGLGNDVSSLASGHLSLNAFLRRYGHLRAGTYNILTPRYDQIPDLFRDLRPSLSLDHAPAPLSMTSRQVTRITSDLLKSGIQCSGEALLRFIKQTLELRESSKFEFTRALSAALEHIAIAGSDLGLSREQIASVDLDSLLAFRGPAGVDPQRIHDTWVASAVAGSEEQRLYRRLALPPVLTSGRDLVAAMDYSSRPNFVTQKMVRGAIAELNDIDYANVPQLRDKIVLLENADPGYDWIFTRHPLGLLTKYGGVASHMAIRCAELGVPAALGCGGALFDRIKAAGVVTLDCATQSIALV